MVGRSKKCKWHKGRIIVLEGVLRSISEANIYLRDTSTTRRRISMRLDWDK